MLILYQKTKKARSAQEKSTIVKTEGKINVSNVQLVCPSCKKATRVSNKVVDGKSTRTCKHCGASLDEKVKKTTTAKAVSKSKPAEAKVEKTTTAKKAVTKKSTETKKAPAKKSASKTAPKKSITRNGGDK